LGKFTCDDSSVCFSLSQGGKPLPLRVVNREVLASDWKEIKYAIPVKASPGTKQMAAVRFPDLQGIVTRSLARRPEAKAALTPGRLSWPQVK
jgi:hypothetical protein